uniref:Uncharacterized protein n=1 Tax=mine drainage metagenome TaxID=410659 RepID=E6PJI3_9ZZZZ
MPQSKDRGLLYGDMTLRGVAKPVVFHGAARRRGQGALFAKALGRLSHRLRRHRNHRSHGLRHERLPQRPEPQG